MYMYIYTHVSLVFLNVVLILIQVDGSGLSETFGSQGFVVIK